MKRNSVTHKRGNLIKKIKFKIEKLEELGSALYRIPQ